MHDIDEPYLGLWILSDLSLTVWFCCDWHCI